MREIPHYSASDIFSIGMEKTISALKTSIAISSQPIPREHIPLDQGEDRVVVYPTQDFTYVVEALDSNGCESREEIQVYVDTCITSIINLLSAQVNIYPNPSNAEITIRLTELETFDLEIYDVLGNQVYFEENVFNKKVISKSILSSGTYLIKIKSQEDAYFGKLVFY